MKMQILMKRMRILRVIHEMRGSDFVIPFTSGRAHLYMGGAHIIPLRFATLVRSPRGVACLRSTPVVAKQMSTGHLATLHPSPMRTALLRRGRSYADSTKGLCPLDTHPK